MGLLFGGSQASFLEPFRWRALRQAWAVPGEHIQGMVKPGIALLDFKWTDYACLLNKKAVFDLLRRACLAEVILTQRKLKL